MRAVLAALLVAVGGVILAGCEATVGERPLVSRVGQPEAMRWPSAPGRARIRLVGTISEPADLGVKLSIWRRIGEVIAGQRDEQMVRPTGVTAVGPTIFVADPGSPALWIVDTASGRFDKVTHATGETLVSPVSVTLGPPDHLYVADSYRAKVFVFRPDGKPAGVIADAGFKRPAGVAYDAPRDRLYVADSGSHRVWVFGRDGQLRDAIGERGEDDGEFNFPTHVAVDGEGRLFVTDALGFRIQWFTAEGKFAGKFGRQGDSAGHFASPKGVALDSEGHVYVVDALFDAVQIFDRQGRLLLTFGERGTGPGRFWLPGGVFIDARDRIYVADAYNRRIQLFDYLPGGEDD